MRVSSARSAGRCCVVRRVNRRSVSRAKRRHSITRRATRRRSAARRACGSRRRSVRRLAQLSVWRADSRHGRPLRAAPAACRESSDASASRQRGETGPPRRQRRRIPARTAAARPAADAGRSPPPRRPCRRRGAAGARRCGRWRSRADAAGADCPRASAPPPRRRWPRPRSRRGPSASRSAASSTSGPRAVLMRYASGRISASSRAPIRWRVSGVSVAWTDTTLDDRSSVSRSTSETPAASASAASTYGSWQRSRTSQPARRRATARPTLPSPIMPIVHPATMRPTSGTRHPPSRMAACLAGTSLSSAVASITTASATPR